MGGLRVGGIALTREPDLGNANGGTFAAKPADRPRACPLFSPSPLPPLPPSKEESVHASLYHPDGRRPQGDHHPPDGGRRQKRTDAGGPAAPAGGRGQGGHLRQQAPHLSGPGGDRQHAAHQDQCEPGGLPGLQGLRCGDAEGDGRGEHGCGGHYGPVQPRGHPALPPEAHPGVPGHHRHGAGV